LVEILGDAVLCDDVGKGGLGASFERRSELWSERLKKGWGVHWRVRRRRRSLLGSCQFARNINLAFLP